MLGSRVCLLNLFPGARANFNVLMIILQSTGLAISTFRS